MKYRRLGKTGFEVSEISLGTWQVGGRWGSPFDHRNAEKILNTAADKGINFIDTADVYGDGESEMAVGRFIKSRPEEIFVATKCGRRLDPHVADAYTPTALEGFVDESLRSMGLETLDLIQLHCPPTEVYYRPEVFGLFEDMKKAGKIRNMGVSVEKVEEALKAMEYENVTTVQIIFNMFRHRPADLFFREAERRDVGIIVRVPLASGLLTGTITRSTRFDESDHRTFNRDGEQFDKGETFSGIDFETGLKAVSELKKIFEGKKNLAPVALRWILDFPEVGCIIPGASKPGQVVSNIEAGEMPELTEYQRYLVGEVYNRRIRPLVHHYW